MMKALNTLVYVVIIAIVLSVAALFLVSLVPIPGNIEVKIVKSGSMEPNIHTGSIVVIEPRTSYSIGEVITFGADTKTDIPTTHRIAKVNPSTGSTGSPQAGSGQATYVTKGDANEDPDPNPVQQSEIIGEVVYTLPYAGYVLDFAKKPLGFTLLIVIPASAIVLDELLAIGREVMKMRRKKKRKDSNDGNDGTGGGEYADEYTRSMYWEPGSMRSMSGDIRPRIRV